MTTAPTKNPAELMAELTDQVRLLRLDVTNLTATAVSQDEATELRTHLHQTLRETNANALKILQGAEAMAIEARTHSVEAARDAAQRAVSGLSGEIRDAGNALRREALKSRREALFHSGGVLAVFGGLVALGAILGALTLFWLQGRADARAFGEHPRIFCKSAGGEVVTATSGRRFCAFWIDPEPKP